MLPEERRLQQNALDRHGQQRGTACFHSETTLSSAIVAASVQFDYPTTDEPAPSPTMAEAKADAVRGMSVFLRDHIIGDIDGRQPNLAAIAIKLIVFQAITDPDPKRSLRADARTLGVTRSHLSKVAREITAATGMRAPWQRTELRSMYSARAKAVHAGNYTPTAKWERRKMRDAQAGQ